MRIGEIGARDGEREENEARGRKLRGLVDNSMSHILLTIWTWRIVVETRKIVREDTNYVQIHQSSN